jgi:thiol-disulfide isomerase/thioredoxin
VLIAEGTVFAIDSHYSGREKSHTQRGQLVTHLARASAALLLATGLAAAASAAGDEVAGKQPTPVQSTKEPKPAAQPAAKAETGSKAEAKTLKVGDTAPPLSVDAWVKGDAVSGFEKGRVYVIEFWATWCIPCRASMPHLTELQKKYKDLTVICVAGNERVKKDEKDQRLDNLRKFVKERDADMGFRVAYDARNAMTAGWMTPAGQRGIPCGFIVDGDGKIAYVGYPMEKAFEKAFVTAMEKARTGTATAAAQTATDSPASASAATASAAPRADVVAPSAPAPAPVN